MPDSRGLMTAFRDLITDLVEVGEFDGLANEEPDLSELEAGE